MKCLRCTSLKKWRNYLQLYDTGYMSSAVCILKVNLLASEISVVEGSIVCMFCCWPASLALIVCVPVVTMMIWTTSSSGSSACTCTCSIPKNFCSASIGVQYCFLSRELVLSRHASPEKGKHLNWIDLALLYCGYMILFSVCECNYYKVTWSFCSCPGHFMDKCSSLRTIIATSAIWWPLVTSSME